MAVAVESRKRLATPFCDDPFCDPAKRGRYTTPCAAQALDALRGIFPDASPRDLEACFAACGGDINAAAQAYRDQLAMHELASRLVQGTADECAAVLMQQIAAATDASDARNRASWILGLIKNAAAAEAAEAATLREENATLREQTARLREEAAALRERAEAADRDNAVLKGGVLAVLKEYM
ncbi:hypothetical protein ACQ4PT_029635 [Festuca glaucescens]